MRRNLVKGLIVVLVAMVGISTLALAAEKTMAKTSKNYTLMGTIDNMDAKKGIMTLKTMDGKSRPLKVSKKSMEGLQVGDQIKVEMAGKRVKSIKKEAMEEKMGGSKEEKKS